MKYYSILLLFFLFVCCQKQEPMPDYGEVNIPGSYTNHLGNTVTAEDVKGKVVIADFIFTSCTQICIPMAGQMQKVQKEYSDEEDLKILSFSIDPERDTIGRLKWYSEQINNNDDQWWFLRADRELIQKTAKELNVFQEKNDTVPDGFDHQSWFVVIDKDGHWRGSYDGTQADDVDQLIKDIKQLL